LTRLSGSTIELYDTDGSVGAANGAGIGSGTFGSFQDAFENLNKMLVVEPGVLETSQVSEAYEKWKQILEFCLDMDK